MCREAVVGRHPDVVNVKESRLAQSVLDVQHFTIEPPKRFDRRWMPHSQGMSGGVGIAQPHDRHYRIDRRKSDLQKRVCRAAVSRVVWVARGRRWTQLYEHALVKRCRQGIVGMKNGAASDGVVQEEYGAARARADCQHLLSVRSKRFAQRRGCEQDPILVVLNSFEVGSLAGVEKAVGVNTWEEHG